MLERLRSRTAPEPGERRAPGGLERGRVRRRLRHQQRVREALLLDLGALVYELHRQGVRRPELLQAKAAELSAVDREVRGLADALGSGQDVLQLVAAGIAGSCSSCGALLTTDARFCAHCGVPAGPALSAEHEASYADRQDAQLDPGEDAPAEEVAADEAPAAEPAQEGATDEAPAEEPPAEAADAAPAEEPPEGDAADTKDHRAEEPRTEETTALHAAAEDVAAGIGGEERAAAAGGDGAEHEPAGGGLGRAMRRARERMRGSGSGR